MLEYIINSGIKHPVRFILMLTWDGIGLIKNSRIRGAVLRSRRGEAQGFRLGERDKTFAGPIEKENNVGLYLA